MTHFLFLPFPSFPPFETAGMSLLPQHLSARDRRDRFDFFFFNFFSPLPQFEMAGLNCYYFFSFFCFFWATYVQ